MDQAKEWLAGVFDRAAPTYDVSGGGYHDHFGTRLVERAGVAEGHRVLDVACGRGAALVPAARAAGAGGSVVGIDLSPAMVELAADALRTADVPGSAEVGDAEDLRFADADFDRVLCAFGLFFLPRPEVAVGGFHRVLAEGGVIAVSTWGTEDPRWAWEDELLADVQVERRALVRAFDRPADLEDLLTRSGFVDPEIVVETHDVVLADADEWWAWKWSFSFRGVLEQLSPQRVERLRHEAEPHLAALAGHDGMPLRLQALLATARRPDR